MYQIIIIDDEPIVREGLKNLIPWEEYGYQICAEGIDGRDGLKKILEYSPELVLVDIKMPGLSGIELIKEARMNGYEGNFIILTGYSDFSYARSAVSLGVRAYLLKPIMVDELILCISEIKTVLDFKKHQEHFHNLCELKARQEVLRRLLISSDNQEELRRDMQLYNMDYHNPSFCVVIIHQKENNQEVGPSLMDDELLENLIKRLNYIEKIVMDHQLVFICKAYDYEVCHDIHKWTKNVMKGWLRDDYFIAIGHNVAHFEDIHFSYETAKFLSEYRFLYEEQRIVSIDIFRDDITEIDMSPEKISGYIDIGDLESIDLLYKRAKEFFKSKLMKEAEIKVLMINNMLLLRNILEQKYRDSMEAVPSFKQLVSDLQGADNLDSLMDMVMRYITKVVEGIGVSSDHAIKRMIAYMNKNYEQDLKLKELAKMFNYNSAYLGKVFRKEVGEGFNDVLNRIRIENAKRLLNETDLKVYQVSKAVGYQDIDYFYSTFKKMVGVSPKEYKREK